MERSIWRRLKRAAQYRGRPIRELAVAKALGIYWSGLAKLADADVGGYHVRFSANPASPLRVRPREKAPPERRYVLVVGTVAGERYDAGSVVVRIAGGATAAEAMVRPLSDPGERGCPCWSIPQAELTPLRVSDRRFVRADLLPAR